MKFWWYKKDLLVLNVQNFFPINKYAQEVQHGPMWIVPMCNRESRTFTTFQAFMFSMRGGTRGAYENNKIFTIFYMHLNLCSIDKEIHTCFMFYISEVYLKEDKCYCCFKFLPNFYNLWGKYQNMRCHFRTYKII